MSDENEKFTKSNCKSNRDSITGLGQRLESDPSYLKDFRRNWIYNKDLCGRLLILAFAVDSIMECPGEGSMNEILWTYDLDLMSESTKSLKKKFLNWKGAFESKGLKVNIKKTKMMMTGSKGKVDSCIKWGKRAMTNLVLCSKCGKWVHGRCARMKWVSSTLAKGFACKEMC